MKISIGINTYKQEKDFTDRQKFCVESLRKVKAIYPDIVELYNITFEDEDIKLEGFTSLPKLKIKVKEVLDDYFRVYIKECDETRQNLINNYNKRLPSVYEIFEVLSEQNSDYFLFLNDDIILSDRFIKNILDNLGYDSYPASRIHLLNFKGLDDKEITMESYSVHGFDAFAINTKWWKKQHYNFPNYILGKPYWDTHYFTLCQLFGNAFVLNKLPPVMFHPEHASTSCTTTDIALQYNEDIFNRALIIKQLWFTYVHKVLLMRKPSNGCKWMIPFNNEPELEKGYFKQAITLGFTSPTDNKQMPLKITSNHKVDVILPCAPKDYIKLPYALESVQKHIKELGNIHICTPNRIGVVSNDSNVFYHLDMEVLPNVKPELWKFRPNWIYQQMIKLFQNITDTEYYLTYDVDGILNRTLPMFNGEHPIWYKGWRQNEISYSMFNHYFLGLEKTKPHTFIGDLCFFNKIIIKDMLSRYNLTPETFVQKSYDLVKYPCHIGEPELYGSYFSKYYPDLYEVRDIKQYHYGKVQNDVMVVNWTKGEIEALVAQYKDQDYDIIQMHSWCGDSKNYWEKT